jgi:hypothetical protein
MHRYFAQILSQEILAAKNYDEWIKAAISLDEIQVGVTL